ncbi:DUF4376 domain-containing protein [Roseixanthobacter glucoisosaccharinicivorans]|uniref:DUF4376 domain-containing protein n=1 Tax=Roseixanthobacter glucoisosaccharinicivorans TaxID=3119923 RepID=UPI00372B6EBC
MFEPATLSALALPVFAPSDWYWIADDGRIYSSARQITVAESDSDYVSWTEKSRATRWPCDEDGHQTDSSLAEVLSTYGIRYHSGPTVYDVIAERDRRLALGFSYDFGDSRGVHRIGTTPEDQQGWSEVTTLAQALLASGDAATPISIITDTGPATVTAQEWMAVLLAAGDHRQPIWSASFLLQGLDPIPANYADDGYWPA